MCSLILSPVGKGNIFKFTNIYMQIRKTNPYRKDGIFTSSLIFNNASYLQGIFLLTLTHEFYLFVVISV